MKRLLSVKGILILTLVTGTTAWFLNLPTVQATSANESAPTDRQASPDREIKGATGNKNNKASGPGAPSKSSPKPHSYEAKFIKVESAKFLMGAQATDINAPGYDVEAGKDEGPPRWVTVDAFAIQKREVNAGMYQKCVRASACAPIESTSAMLTTGSESKLRLPINFVTWDDAVQYCNYIDARLPTEAEWELAARGSDGRRFPFGDYPMCASNTFLHEKKTNERGRSPSTSPCARVTKIALQTLPEKEVQAMTQMVTKELGEGNMTPVCIRLKTMSEEENVAIIKEIKRTGTAAPLKTLMGGGSTDGKALSFASNPRLGSTSCELKQPPVPSDSVKHHPLGVEQLAGSMWEWVSDYYADSYDKAGGSSNPQGPKTGTRRVQRGGGWMSSSQMDFRGAVRASLDPKMRMPDVGFRCARSL